MADGFLAARFGTARFRLEVNPTHTLSLSFSSIVLRCSLTLDDADKRFSDARSAPELPRSLPPSRRPMIGRVILLTAMFVGLPGSLASQTRAADSAAIVHLVHQHVESMRALRANLQRAIYAPDAVWINAFGRRIVGRDSIVAFLGALYAEPGYAGSRIVRETPPELLFVRPDVATVHEFHEREGQRMADGSVIARRTHTTFVVSKEAGRWLIRYQHISDERVRATQR